ncbi:MAG: 2-oxo acid dehydrogenase subunit E2, partial [Spirochaeta sp.]
VTGSGPKGRISRDDVKDHARKIISESRQEDTAGAGKQRGSNVPEPEMYTGPLPDFSRWGKTERESMNKVRQITAQSTWSSWQVIPQVTQHDSADISALESFREQYGDVVEKQGGKLTVTAIIIKIVAAALQKFPKFNASLDIKKQEIIYKHFINIGVAADTPRGLLVPVLRDVDQKDLTQIALELGALADKARNKKISPDEMQGGNFTVSNLGGIGGSFFTPIVFWPQVAILGVGKARMEPVPADDGIETKPILPLSLSYDHRVIDGAEGARFLHSIAESLENPFLLFMDAK